VAKLSKDRLIFGVFLLVIIALGEIILGHMKLAAWPAFMVMIFFFEAHMDLKKAPNILVGGVFGISNLILIKIFITALAPSLGVELAKLIYILVFVYLIVAFGEILPFLFNNYAFMFFLVSGVAAKAPDPNVFVWMATTIVGGGIFIGAIIGTATMLNKLLAPKS
jgi:hypothetical protein